MSDKYKNCFKSQAGMWIHLLAGKKIRCVEDMQIYELGEDGNLHTCYSPNMYGIWEPYKEPKWYDNIPPQGVLCWVGHDPDMPHNRIVVVVDGYDKHHHLPFINANGTKWRSAIPLTWEEAVNLIYNSQGQNYGDQNI